MPTRQALTPQDTADVDMKDENAAAGPSSGAFTGRYNLTAVLTHKGRTADSGHYVAWIKVSGTRPWSPALGSRPMTHRCVLCGLAERGRQALDPV